MNGLELAAVDCMLPSVCTISYDLQYNASTWFRWSGNIYMATT